MNNSWIIHQTEFQTAWERAEQSEIVTIHQRSQDDYTLIPWWFPQSRFGQVAEGKGYAGVQRMIDTIWRRSFRVQNGFTPYFVQVPERALTWILYTLILIPNLLMNSGHSKGSFISTPKKWSLHLICCFVKKERKYYRTGCWTLFAWDISWTSSGVSLFNDNHSKWCLMGSLQYQRTSSYTQ